METHPKAKFIEDCLECCANWGLIPTEFRQCMTWEEQVLWLTKFIKEQVLPTVNANTAAFNTLKDFVEHYFDNLDVQEEINNKLDEMAEAGTLQEIIAEYLGLGTMFTFDTVAEMIASEALIAGSKCQTLGKETINDGYGAIYTIGDSGEILLDNGKYATMIGNTQSNNYIEEITVTTGRANDTDYTVATIPLNDDNGDLIALSVNEDETKTPLTYAEKNFTTITSNAGLTRQNSSSQWKQGAVISNGVVLHGDLCDVSPQSYMSYIGFKADRTALDFPATTSTDVMIAQGVENAYLTFGKIVVNGVVDIPSGVDPDEINPMNCLGIKNDGTILIIVSEGRTKSNKGMSISQMASLALSLGCTNAWRCDGGGSNSLVYKGSKQNRNIDQTGTYDRPIYVTLNFKKPTIDKQLAEVYSFIGKERQLLNKQIRQDIDYTYKQKHAFCDFNNWSGGYNTVSTDDQNINLQFQDFNSNDNKPLNAPDQRIFKIITNSSNRHIGFKMNVTGLFEVTYTVNVLCANTAGLRRAYIGNTAGGAPVSNYHSHFDSYITPTAANQTYCFSGKIVMNNSTAGTDYYFGAKGKAGDDFNRVYVTIRHIGQAGS